MVWLLVPVAAALYVLVAGVPWAEPTAQLSRAVDDPEITVDDLLDGAVEQADGAVTVTLTEAETSALVRAGLAQSQAPPLREVMVDLVAPDGGQEGRMIVSGRLSEQPLPVRATVDLDVVDTAVRPTVRAATVGPVAVPASVRRDLGRQLRGLVLIADRNVVVEELRTTDSALILTGRRR